MKSASAFKVCATHGVDAFSICIVGHSKRHATSCRGQSDMVSRPWAAKTLRTNATKSVEQSATMRRKSRPRGK